MRFLPLIVLIALASCASAPVLPDFSQVGKLYRDAGGYGTALPVAHTPTGFLVLTCWHVIAGASEFNLDAGGTMYLGGVVVWFDEVEDTALVEFKCDERPALYELTKERARPYSRGYVAGYPCGAPMLIVTDVLHQQDRSLVCGLNGPGGSGGPIFDEHGRVVALTSRIATPAVHHNNGQRAGLHARFSWMIIVSRIDTAIDQLAKIESER